MAGVSSTSLTGLGLSGLSSGLDTSGIITKLMAIETAPKTALQSKLASATTYRTALQSVNTAVAGVASSAKDAAKPAGLASFTATSTSSAVAVKASSSAIAGRLSFAVDAVASSQVSVTDPLQDSDSVVIPAITFRTGTGAAQKDTTVPLTSNRLDDVVAAINGSAAGVTATKVPAGIANGVQQYRLQLASKDTGAAGTFSAAVGSSYDAGTPMPLTTITPPQDAQITLYGGTAAQQVVTSSSNTFSSLMTGVDVTVSATTTTAATITVAADASAATTAAQSLVTGLSTLFAGIASASAVTTIAGTNGSTSTTGSVFTGDSAVRLLKDALLSAATDPVGGRSPSEIGITLTKEGSVTFDQAKFSAAMQSDAAGTTAMFQSIAGRLADKATGASDPYTGTLTKRIASQQSTESSLTKDIDDWTTRLAVIQAQYTTQFNALETALNSLSSQANYLTGQIAGLTTNYQNK